jgi:hypothetical protein
VSYEIRRGENEEPSIRGFVRIELDDTNVFEDSPTAVILEVGGDGEEQLADFGQTINCGGVELTVSAIHADARICLRISEAQQLHAELGKLLQEAAA